MIIQIKTAPIIWNYVDGNWNHCVEYEESYFEIKQTVDWIECHKCKKWMHQSCMICSTKRNECGKNMKEKT